MHNIGLTIRWKEELVASSAEASLVFEITMGTLHVYFPDENRWKNHVLDWAKMKWNIYLEAAREWRRQSNIPISVVPDAYVYEQKAEK